MKKQVSWTHHKLITTFASNFVQFFPNPLLLFLEDISCRTGMRGISIFLLRNLLVRTVPCIRPCRPCNMQQRNSSLAAWGGTRVSMIFSEMTL